MASQRTTVQEGRGPSRWRSGLSKAMVRLQPALRGARAPQVRVVRLFPRECVRWRVRVCAHANAGCSLEAVDGTSEQGRAPRERAVSLAQCASIGHGLTPTSATEYARAASARAAPPPSSERAQWRARALSRESGLRVGGRGWHVGARPCIEGGWILLVRWPSVGNGSTLTSAAWHARASKAHVLCLLPTESQRSSAIALCHTKADCALETAAGHSEHGLAPRGRGFSQVQWPPVEHEPTPTSAARRARASQARVLRHLPRESQRSGVQAHYTHKPPHEVWGKDRTWEPGLATKKGGFSLGQYPSIVHGAIAASAARRARATSARAGSRPQREPAQRRASALHEQAT